MFLPAQEKPNMINPNGIPLIIEYPNVITKDIANEIITFAHSEHSGIHRRGSKSPRMITSSFYTCLMWDTSHKLYELLDPVWEKYCKLVNANLSFIEWYEIKSYIEGDEFGYHHDGYCNYNFDIDRKVNMIVQLSDEIDYDGGDLIVNSRNTTRNFGSAIFFPAHLMHSVTPITRGTRYSLIGHGWGPLNF